MFKIGDKVYDIRVGNGVVKEIRNDKEYPISVESRGDIFSYTKEGYYVDTDVNRSLYHGYNLTLTINELERR